MRAYERLLNYVKVYTTSEDEQENVPSTSRQFDLGNQLAEELKKIGVQDVRIDDKCYVYGVIITPMNCPSGITRFISFRAWLS